MTEAVRKVATEQEVFRLGALVLGLHNALHGRDFTDDGEDFETPEERFEAMRKSWMEKAAADAAKLKGRKGKKKKPKRMTSDDQYKAVQFMSVAKSINEEKRLITAVVLRPNVVDLHGDTYDEETVEAACHDFNKNSRQANLQHVANTTDDTLAVVESAIAKHGGKLGDGEIVPGDWVMTMHVPNDDIWKAVMAGDFTGFSVGCVAEVEELEDAA